MTEPAGPDEVDAAVAAITECDEQLGRAADSAAMELMAGEGTALLSQASIQETLWWRVPKRYPEDAWFEWAAGAAALFDELGLDRYAAIARSDDTREVLEAWMDSRAAGNKRANAARNRSGVAVPDTELLVWGQAFGLDEGAALDACERALEAAIVAGDLVPGGRGSKATAIEITDRTLTAPLDFPPGQTLLTTVTTERVATWIRSARSPDLQAMRESVANRLLTPVAIPDGAETIVAPMRWLLEQVGDGVTLSQSGYLPRAMVLDAAERFAWWDWDKPPRSEADLIQLDELRQLATDLRLLRKKAKKLAVTTKVRAALADPAAMWSVVVEGLGGVHEFENAIAECVAMVLLDGPSLRDNLPIRVGPIVQSLGWRTADGPVDVVHVRHAVYDCTRAWTAIGVIEHRRGRREPGTMRELEPRSDRLTEAGEAAALAYLRRRATAPNTFG